MLGSDRLLVGARGLTPTGTQFDRRAYLFVRQGASWTQRSTLLLPPIDNDSRFGSTILLAGDTAIIGAAGERVTAEATGAVHVFVESDDAWTVQQTLTAPDVTSVGGFGGFGGFGESLALHHDLLMVGAPRQGHGHASNARGAVYFFRRTGSQWQFESRIDVPAAAADAAFGSAVALDEQFAYVGLPAYAVAPATTQRSGAVLVYPREGQGWGEPVLLSPDSARIEPRFGQALTVGPTQIVVGAPFVIGTSSGEDGWDVSGTVFVFRKDAQGWQQSQRLTAPASNPHVEGFGERLASDPSTLLIGTPRSAGPPPYGNPTEGAAIIYGDGSLRFADGFER